MKPKITLLIHGPYAENAYSEIFKELKKVSEDKKRRIHVLIVCYENEWQKTKEVLEKLKIEQNYLLLTVKDTFNPGFFNINRQIISVRRGLSEIAENNFVIKLRNDQWVSFHMLFHILEKNKYLIGTDKKILTTNCYTRRDRLYHPSDMFLCAWKEELDAYYSCPLQTMTHMDCQMSMVEKAAAGVQPFEEYFTCPEIMLFRHYLTTKGWFFENTKEDSFEAIKKWCFVVNTWDIMLRWNKERPPQLKRGSLILPYPFVVAPFAGAPVEHADYYNRHDFYGRMTKEDKNYLLKAKGDKFEEQNTNGGRHKILSKIRIFVSKHSRLKKLLLSGTIGELSRKLYAKSFE